MTLGEVDIVTKIEYRVKGGGSVLDTFTVTSAIPRQPGELVSRSELETAARDTWQELLGSPLHPLRRDAAFTSAVSATVGLSGAKSVVAVVSAPPEVASDAAVRVLGLQRDELAPGDIADAFAELVMAIGSKLQVLLPGRMRIGHPGVTQGAGLTTALPGARMICESVLANSVGPIRITLWRTLAGRLPAPALDEI